VSRVEGRHEHSSIVERVCRRVKVARPHQGKERAAPEGAAPSASPEGPYEAVSVIVVLVADEL